MRIFFLSVVIIMLAGCQSIPPGDAPDGAIVDPKITNREYSWRGAENYMLTSLSAFCLQNFPHGSSFSTDFPYSDQNLSNRSRMLLYSLCNSVPIQMLAREDAAYCLSSRMDKEKVWYMRLIDVKNKKVVWQEKVKIKERR